MRMKWATNFLLLYHPYFYNSFPFFFGKIRIPRRKGNGTTAANWCIRIYFLILPLTFALLHALYKVSLPDFLQLRILT